MEQCKETHENKIYYVNNENEQSQYINIFKENNLNAVILNCSIDNHFITLLERENPNLSFLRIDSDISDILKIQKIVMIMMRKLKNYLRKY